MYVCLLHIYAAIPSIAQPFITYRTSTRCMHTISSRQYVVCNNNNTVILWTTCDNDDN